jgi:hypothetical protein
VRRVDVAYLTLGRHRPPTPTKHASRPTLALTPRLGPLWQSSLTNPSRSQATATIPRTAASPPSACLSLPPAQTVASAMSTTLPEALAAALRLLLFPLGLLLLHVLSALSRARSDPTSAAALVYVQAAAAQTFVRITSSDTDPRCLQAAGCPAHRVPARLACPLSALGSNGSRSIHLRIRRLGSR